MIFSVCNISITTPDMHDSNDNAMKFVKMVQKRYYLVHRLEKPISFLMDFYRSAAKKNIFNVWSLDKPYPYKDIIVPTGVSDQFKHPLVIKYMRDLENEHNIRAINDLWSDFLSYKYIEDELFVRETIIVIVIAYKALVLNLGIQKNSSALQDFFYITGKNGMQGRQELYDNFDSILNLLDESYDKEDFVITNNLRHYHIQRLLKSIIILTKVNSQYLLPLWDCLTQTVNKHSISFQHKAVQECLETILQTKSLEPLFNLWRHFTAYKFANDSLFLQEFVALEYMLYCKLIDCLRIVTLKDSPTAEDLIELYTSIATLPIPEMLNSLDTLVEELIDIMEKYELNAAISWTQWFKKYWWVPPVVISSFIVNFLLNRRSDNVAKALP